MVMECLNIRFSDYDTSVPQISNASVFTRYGVNLKKSRVGIENMISRYSVLQFVLNGNFMFMILHQ